MRKKSMQRGFSLLEVSLALGISGLVSVSAITAAGMGWNSYRLADEISEIHDIERVVHTNAMFTSSADYNHLTPYNLYLTGMLAKRFVTPLAAYAGIPWLQSPFKQLISAYPVGAPFGSSTFRISVPTISTNECVSLSVSQQDIFFASLTVGSNPSVNHATTGAQAAAWCAGASRSHPITVTLTFL
jgi:prepilin-type N-terminal cleavage/methylation domain-containing protein